MKYLLIKAGEEVSIPGVTPDGPAMPVQPISWVVKDASHTVVRVDMPSGREEQKAAEQACTENVNTTLLEGADIEDALSSVGLELLSPEDGIQGVQKIEAAVGKSDITILSESKGKANKEKVKDWPPGSVVFLGFSGSRGADGKYHGCLSFAPAAPSEKYETFLTLPGLENTDGVQSHTDNRVSNRKRKPKRDDNKLDEQPS